MPITLHGLTWSRTDPHPGAPPHVVVPFEGLAAICSETSCAGSLEDAEAAAAHGLFHNALLCTYAADEDVLPVRLGTVFSSREALRGGLSARHDDLRRGLSALKDSCEYVVRLVATANTRQGLNVRATSGRAFLSARREDDGVHGPGRRAADDRKRIRASAR